MGQASGVDGMDGVEHVEAVAIRPSSRHPFPGGSASAMRNCLRKASFVVERGEGDSWVAVKELKLSYHNGYSYSK